MRKRQQRQILDLLITIGQAQSIGSYGDCQDGALSICDFIESIVGKGTKTAALLIEYCEFLFRANNGEIGENALRKQLVKIENSVKQELKPDRTEMVFLSYKAAMSDALETIYLAAKADPDCDAFWIPIPYLELMPGGTAKQMVYEGAEYYPDYIKCTDWQQYDIEARQPDAIFTFAPYDAHNYVTSVHPNFYCERLRGLTDMLCYVPYFVVDDDVPEHFATLAGCVYAHMVVVQSEKVRKTYIRAFANAYGNRFGKPEDKFVALGSPKFDRVINAKREDYPLPEEWRRLIENDDGTHKPVVLYNTRFTDMTDGIENQIAKLKNVLNMFKMHNRIALWWRPHPLNVSCLHAMRPQYASEYEKIVDEYRHDAYGIYDESSDLHKAIAVSDAYYGDWSSVVALFGAAGKPVVIQDVNSFETETLLKIADFAFDDDGNAWAFDVGEDGLFKLDFENSTAQLMVRSKNLPEHMDKEIPNNPLKYIKIHCSGEKVACFPYFADNIMVYDHKTKSLVEIPLDHDYMLPYAYKGFALKFASEHESRIYAFGSLSKAIIVLDMSSNSVTYDTLLFGRLGLLVDKGTHVKYPLYMSECSPEGKVTLLMRNCEHLIEYTLPTQGIEIVTSNPVLSKCVHADYDGRYYWLLTEKNKTLIKWDPTANNKIEYHMTDSGFFFLEDDNVFAGIVDCEKYILLFPAYGNMILRFDKQTEQFSEYTEMPLPDSNESDAFKYDKPKAAERKIYAFARFNSRLYELNKTTDEVIPHSFSRCFTNYFSDIHVPVDDTRLGNIAVFFNESIDNETNTDYSRGETFLDSSINNDGSAGKLIYKYVCEVLTK